MAPYHVVKGPFFVFMDNGATEPVGETWQYDEGFHKMSNLMGVDKYDRNDFELAKKLSYLRDSTGSQDESEAMGKIEDLRKKLGLNTQGKTLIDQLYQHVRLQGDRARTQPSKPTLKPQSKTSSQSSLEKTVSQAVQQKVQQTVGSMVQKALSDKKLVESAVQEALKGIK